MMGCLQNTSNFVKKNKTIEEILADDSQPIAINPDSPMARGYQDEIKNEKEIQHNGCL